MIRALLFILATVALFAGCASDEPEWTLDPALGIKVAALPPLPPPPEWPGNLATPEKDELGNHLYNDLRLSGSQTVACRTCHIPVTDYAAAAVRVDVPDRSYPHPQPALERNTPSLLNLVYMPVFRWDGSHPGDIVDMMVLPFAEPNMNLTPEIPAGDVKTVDIPAAQVELKRRLTELVPGYVPMFERAFGVDIRELSDQEVWRYAGMAMAVYIRRAVSRNSPFDRWNTGEDDALSDGALRGLDLFIGKGRCVACHYGEMFSDFEFHNIGSAEPFEPGQERDEGRYLVTGLEEDRGKFLTPSLRTAHSTSPYLHNGRYRKLVDVIKHKVTLARQDPMHDPLLDDMEMLTDDEAADVAEFLKSLSGEPVPWELREAPDPIPN